MRRGCINARRQHGNEGRVVAPIAVGPENGLLLNLGDQHVFRQARLHQFKDPGMHGIGDLRSPADEGNLQIALHAALPIHETRRIMEIAMALKALSSVVWALAENQ